MKIATSSTSFDRFLTSGELTQLEWIDWCATELPVDGVVLDVRHFPRVDADYLAQVKKMCVDLGVTVAGVRSDDLFASHAAFDIALAVGAPLILAQASDESDDPQNWTSAVGAAQAASREAKRVNVPIALRAREGTIAPDAAALKRLAKDVDSAWLRYAFDPGAPGAGDPLAGILARSIVAAHESVELDAFGADVHADISGALRGLGGFRGFFALDYIGEGDVRARVTTQLMWLRTMLAKETLDQHA